MRSLTWHLTTRVYIFGKHDAMSRHGWLGNTDQQHKGWLFGIGARIFTNSELVRVKTHMWICLESWREHVCYIDDGKHIFWIQREILVYRRSDVQTNPIFEIRNGLWKNRSMFNLRFVHVCRMSHSMELMLYSGSRRPVRKLRYRKGICFIDDGDIDRNPVTSGCCEALLLIVYILLFSGLKPTSGPIAGICWIKVDPGSRIHYIPGIGMHREGGFLICNESACQWNDLAERKLCWSTATWCSKLQLWIYNLTSRCFYILYDLSVFNLFTPKEQPLRKACLGQPATLLRQVWFDEALALGTTETEIWRIERSLQRWNN